MSSYSFLSNFSYESDYSTLFDPFSQSFGGLGGVWPGGSMLSNSLVLDNEKCEFVKTSAAVGEKGVSEAKALAALKNHSEAERRRRQRINAHLFTLRGFVPCSEKMDKATLLAEVISEVKSMKKKASEASKGLFIPMDADELRVKPHNNGAGDGTLSFKASISCAYRSELLTDLRQALDALNLRIDGAEISTLGNRVKMSTHQEQLNQANGGRSLTLILQAHLHDLVCGTDFERERYIPYGVHGCFDASNAISAVCIHQNVRTYAELACMQQLSCRLRCIQVSFEKLKMCILLADIVYKKFI